MKRIFYGWFICAACTLLIFISMGMVSNGFSVFMPFLMERYGLTNAQTSSLVTLRCLVVLFAMLTTGVYYDRLGMRLGTALAAGFAGVAYLCYSFGRSYALFGVGAAISGLSYGFGSMIPASILMNRWFVRHRALALGICSAGSGVATIVLPGVFTWLVERLGLTAGFQAGCGMIFVGAALIFLVQREDPAQLGLPPLGAEDAPERKPLPRMRIAVAGTGYVGLSLAALLSQRHQVTAVDINEERVERINRWESPIQDAYLEKYLAEHGERGLDLRATTDTAAYGEADFVLIAVPTNYDPKTNFFDCSAVESVLAAVRAASEKSGSRPYIVIRSTVPVVSPTALSPGPMMPLGCTTQALSPRSRTASSTAWVAMALLRL